MRQNTSAIVTLIFVEAFAFSLAAILHCGVPIFGFAESRRPSEATAQGLIAALLVISALGIWKRKFWAKRTALIVHFLGLAGAFFGLIVSSGTDGHVEFDLYGLARLTALVAVPILLLTSCTTGDWKR